MGERERKTERVCVREKESEIVCDSVKYEGGAEDFGLQRQLFFRKNRMD